MPPKRQQLGLPWDLIRARLLALSHTPTPTRARAVVGTMTYTTQSIPVAWYPDGRTMLVRELQIRNRIYDTHIEVSRVGPPSPTSSSSPSPISLPQEAAEEDALSSTEVPASQDSEDMPSFRPEAQATLTPPPSPSPSPTSESGARSPSPKRARRA